MASTEHTTKRARTKIVSTLGPVSSSPEMIEKLILEGVDVFRINMAHGSREEHQKVFDRIREVSDVVGRPIAILVDLAGPKIRLGELIQDPKICTVGEEIRFITGTQSNSTSEFTTNYKPLIDELSVGDNVMLADGTVALRVTEITNGEAVCHVTEGGTVRSRQGVNLPGVSLSVPAMTERDHDNAHWAAQAGADFISLSFVRTPLEIIELKQLVREHASSAMVIAKIEKQEALQRLDEIVLAADGVMVARGDLGVEIDVAETPMAQKRIIRKCQEYSKPVIVATQMLDSMHKSSRPTRAEASDVANAILDGADACMLSGETAIGEYPLESVAMMNRIMLNTESSLVDMIEHASPKVADGVQLVTSAVVYGAARIADRLEAKLVVIATRTGNTARIKAKQRDYIPTVGVSRNLSTLRQLCLFWGIIPLRGMPLESGEELRAAVECWGREQELLTDGDYAVFVTSSTFGTLGHDELFVHQIED
ncbi:MAG: pyruvate kinase [Planctomycetaceae bacterium]